MRVFYECYRTLFERAGRDLDEYRKLPVNQVLALMPVPEHVTGHQREAVINKRIAEYLWVLEGRPIYYVPEEEARFLLRAHYDCELADAKTEIFVVSPHPRLKMHPMLVDVNAARLMVYCKSNEGNLDFVAHTAAGCDFNYMADSMSAYNDHVRLAYAVWIFRKAFPKAVYDGFPAEMREQAIRHAKKPTGRHIRLPEKYRASPGAHVRTWHWRHLSHERYKRNPDGTVRVILIDDMLVGKVKPKTISQLGSLAGQEGSQPVEGTGGNDALD